MQAMPIIQTVPANTDLETDLQRARLLANWLDARFSIMGIRFGLEGIVGLIPVVGDTLGMLAGAYPIYVAHRHRLGRAVEAQMAANLLIEWGIGVVPFIGDAADIWFKANLRNLKLLERAADRKRPGTTDGHRYECGRNDE
jgi:Domain of unknown function (DUF4112)